MENWPGARPPLHRRSEIGTHRPDTPRRRRLDELPLAAKRVGAAIASSWKTTHEHTADIRRGTRTRRPRREQRCTDQVGNGNEGRGTKRIATSTLFGVSSWTVTSKSFGVSGDFGVTDTVA